MFLLMAADFHAKKEDPRNMLRACHDLNTDGGTLANDVRAANYFVTL